MKNCTLFSVIIFVVTLMSCSKNDTGVTPTIPTSIQKIKLAEGFSAGTKIELYADDTLRTGYNQLYIRALDSATNAVIRDAQLTLNPQMDMGSMTHSCPTEQPTSTQISGDLFPVAAIFTMVGNDSQKWSLSISFRTIATKEGTLTFPISVVKGTFPPKIFMDSDGKEMILAMLPIAKPIVGMNDVEFAVFSNASDVYTPIDDLTMTITPEMPSMGHGSPNNVNPIDKGQGHYTGKVNFIMTGEWKINLALERAGTNIGQQFFMITL
ncbi:MAG: FixH family protein [Ignavibacteria bacterium]|nr:FixH family protein [Ignavibacteria bacterium]